MLSGRKVLRHVYIDHVNKARRSRRHLAGVQEISIKAVITRGRLINHVAAFECAHSILRKIEANQRSLVIGSLPGPVLQVPEKVVDTTVGPKILAATCRMGKRYALA